MNAIAPTPAPPFAYQRRSWREVPRGFYAVPFWDWMKFGDECGPDEVMPDAELLGYLLVVRKTPRLLASGKVVGKDSLAIGVQVLIRGIAEYVVPFRNSDGEREDLRYTPSERLKREIECNRSVARHDGWGGDGARPCRCPDCQKDKRDDARMGLERYEKYPSERQSEAWPDALAGMILHDIENGGSFRETYGKLTGRCGICGRLLTDPKSKLLGIGPDCRGFR